MRHRPATPPSAGHDDRGSITVATALAIAVVLLIVVEVANVIVYQYGRGAVRAALDEGVRLGARSDPGTETGVCEQTATDTLDQLAGGLVDGVTISCADTGTSIQATATVHFDGWLGSITDHDSTLRASAAKDDR